MKITVRELLLSSIFLINASSAIICQKIGGWYSVDSLYEKRMNHAGIQLDNGNILITGGYAPNQGEGSNETELFDIKTLKWNMFVPMNKNRTYHNLIKLNDGSILAIGGFLEKTCKILNNSYTKWTFTDTLKTKRWWGHSTVLMSDGNILLIGGYTDYPVNDTAEVLKECEIYDYLKGEWSAVSNLNIERHSHTSTVLQDGRVLVSGGIRHQNGTILLNSCEIFDSLTKEWDYVAPMHYSRAGHSATLLSNGKVLVIGGQQNYSELYDPQTNTWEVVGPVYLASGHNRAIILRNEEYLLLVHDIDGYIARCGWELYSLKNLESIYYEEFERIISEQAVIKIDDKRVLVSGGQEAIIIGGDLFITPSDFSQIYDINLTSVAEENKYNTLPTVFSLGCYPNPFNGSTNISVSLGTSERISLKVFNVMGELISKIYEGELRVGKYTFSFDMSNYSSGVYFIMLSSLTKSQSIKIIHQK